MKRAVAAVVLAAAAVTAAVLAHDARSWRDALANGDTVYAASPTRATWRASGGAAKTAIGIDDDLALRRALVLYTRASRLRARLDNAELVATARARAQDALEHAARIGDAQQAAQAQTLLGILAFRDGGAEGVDAAHSAFENAVAADPANEGARYDLELLLRLTAAHGSRVSPGEGSGTGSTGRRGAGGGSPGRGY